MLKCDRWKPSPKPIEGKVGFTGGVEYKPETREIWTTCYPEAGTCKKSLSNGKNLYALRLKAPEVEKAGTMHFILRVTDKGSPPLSRYKRVIVTVEPPM